MNSEPNPFNPESTERNNIIALSERRKINEEYSLPSENAEVINQSNVSNIEDFRNNSEYINELEEEAKLIAEATNSREAVNETFHNDNNSNYENRNSNTVFGEEIKAELTDHEMTELIRIRGGYITRMRENALNSGVQVNSNIETRAA